MIPWFYENIKLGRCVSPSPSLVSQYKTQVSLATQSTPQLHFCHPLGIIGQDFTSPDMCECWTASSFHPIPSQVIPCEHSQPWYLLLQGHRELALGAGQACPGVRLPARRCVTHADPGPADPDCLDLHTVCFPQFESGWISNPGGMLALLSWPSWIPDLVLSFNPSVLFVGKQGHTRLCDAFSSLSIVKLWKIHVFI